MLRLLVLDAYAPEGREALRGAGATEGGALYRRMLEGLAPGCEIKVAHPADGPIDEDPRDFDGLCWTGSSLTITAADDPRVRRQVELARRAYEAGTPSFGSCWAAQLAVVAAGGRCATSPKGREFGISRRIALTEVGAAHPLYRGKPRVFDAFTSHADEVVELGGAALLASNAWSRVQAVDVQHGRGRFQAVQYHPEYDCHEVASLCRLRRDELIAQGSFDGVDAAEAFVEDLEALHGDPGRADVAARLGVDEKLADPACRTVEVANWLATLGGHPDRA